MKRFELRPRGVFDRQTNRVVLPTSPEWGEYTAWLDAGNAPDKAQAPAPGQSLDERRAKMARLVDQELGKRAGACTAAAAGAIWSAAQLELFAAVCAVSRGVVAWRDAAGNELQLSEAQQSEVLGSMAAARRGLIDHSWALKRSILSSGNPEAVDITAGWPT